MNTEGKITWEVHGRGLGDPGVQGNIFLPSFSWHVLLIDYGQGAGWQYGSSSIEVHGFVRLRTVHVHRIRPSDL